MSAIKERFEIGGITLLRGDCLEIMPELIKEGVKVDCVVCDPPYELGFMGKTWDSTGIAYNKNTWQLCNDILIAGGYLMAFAGSRTYHRIACAIEDGGFDVRNLIAWLYGCISEDTEILTSEGWKRYDKTILNNSILCYDVGTNNFSYHKPTNIFNYENKHTAYRIQSDYTDQIVSRNHRCIIEREGVLSFEFAENLASKQKICVPILENLPELSKGICCKNSNTSKEQEILQGVFANNFSSNTQGKKEAGKTNMQSLWRRILSNLAKQKQAQKLLLKKMQWKNKRAGLEKTCSQRQSELDRKKRNGIKRKNDRGNKSILEGGSHLSQKKRKLCEPINKICEMSSRIYWNVKKRWLCYGTPFVSCNGDWKGINSQGMCSPYKSQCGRQQAGKSDAFSEQQGTQAIRGRKGYTTTLATIEPIEYKGNVWCVEVPTGAFVARRSGKMFITGNSGFPKSLNISKAIDKMAGAEREVVGSGRKGSNGTWEGECGYKIGEFEITAPATPEAKQWEGWGSQLKPALEPVFLVQKNLTTVFDELLFQITKDFEIIICQLLNVSFVEKLSMQLKADVKEGRSSIVLWNVVIRHIQKSLEKSEKMDMCNLQEEELILWNIVSLWNNILIGNYASRKKFTISMEKEMITELETLKLLIQVNIYQNIIQASEFKASGLNASVDNVALYLSGEKMKYQNIQKLFAQESATLPIDKKITKKLVDIAELFLKIEDQESSVQQNATINQELGKGEREKTSTAKLVAKNLKSLLVIIKNSATENVILKETTKLIPNLEPCCLAQKPCSEKTIAENVLKNGVGGMNIDGCRVNVDKDKEPRKRWEEPHSIKTDYKSEPKTSYGMGNKRETTVVEYATKGRYPSNLLLEDCEEVEAEFAKYGVTPSSARPNATSNIYKNDGDVFGDYKQTKFCSLHNDEGTPSRYFKKCKYEEQDNPSFYYSGKVSQAERSNLECGYKLKDKVPKEIEAEIKKLLDF